MAYRAQGTVAANMTGEDFGGSAQSRNRERRMSEILRAAIEVFKEDGYAGFATRKVAVRTGLTLSNVQYYFPSKENLLRTMVQAFLDDSLKHYRTIASQSDVPAHRRCSVLLDRIFDEIQTTDARKFLYEVWALAQHEPYISSLVKAAYGTYCDIFAGLLRDISPGLSDGECAARALVLTAQGEGMRIFSGFSVDSEKDYAEFIRTTKRSVRLVAGLSERGARAMPEERSLQLAPESDGCNDEAYPAPILAGVFGSEDHLQHGRTELSLRQVPSGSGLYRPTMRNKRREGTINKIVTAAANVLAQDGYASFTLARVAKEAGMLTSALQHYFPNHEDLLQATISALMRTYQDRYAEMSKPSGRPAMERLFNILDDVTDEACDPRVCRFSFEMFALSQRSDVTLDLVSSIYSAYRNVYVDLVREIDPSATNRECLARATLIAMQVEGLMVYTYEAGKGTHGISRVREVVKANAVQIACGPSKGRVRDSEERPV